MTDERDDEGRSGPSRRRFLRGAAGFAALGVSSLVAGPGAPAAAPRRDDDATGDCDDCGQTALPLLAAALFHGGYHGLASAASRSFGTSSR